MSKTGYVAQTQVTAPADLRQLLTPAAAEQSEAADSYFFVRWTHQVSGIKTTLPESLSPEGQWFTAKGELRWKAQRSGRYDLLWLGQIAPNEVSRLSNLAFTPIQRSWRIYDRPVLLHDRRTPQFPNLFDYPTRLQNCLRQRYFRDRDTDIIHFVALTVHPPQTNSAPSQPQGTDD
ncbi:MAG: hypothetical protein AAF329_21260 [Cyanobacteria bacterium P01_A01_bin.17]